MPIDEQFTDRKGLATGGRCCQIHLYLIFSSRIVKLKMKVIVFAAIIGGSSVNRPYTNQKKMPVVKVTYMASEISRVCLVRIIRMAWGKNAIVVNVAAIKPKAVDSFIWRPVRCFESDPGELARKSTSKPWGRDFRIVLAHA